MNVNKEILFKHVEITFGEKVRVSLEKYNKKIKHDARLHKRYKLENRKVALRVEKQAPALTASLCYNCIFHFRILH